MTTNHPILRPATIVRICPKCQHRVIDATPSSSIMTTTGIYRTTLNNHC